MEFDELKPAWTALDGRLAAMEQLIQTIVGREDRRGLRAGLQMGLFGAIAQIAFGIAFVFVGVAFWIAHREVMAETGAGAFLQFYGVLMIMAAAQDIRFSRRVDFAGPVVAIQKALLSWRRHRLICAFVFGFLGAFVWIPMVQIVFQEAWGVDLVHEAPGVIGAFIACGMACLVLLVALAQACRRWPRGRLATWIAQNATGHAYNRVQRELESLRRVA